MGKKLIFYFLLFPVFLFCQPRKVAFEFDMRSGISNIIDQKDNSKFKWNMGALIGINVKDNFDRLFGFKGSLYMLLNGALNLKNNNNIRILNVGISQNALLRINNQGSIISLGVFENILLNKSFASDYVGYDYEFNPFDFGLIVGLSQRIFSLSERRALFLQCSYYKSIKSVYDNQHKVILTNGYSKWTGLNGFTIGFSVDF